jgi:hypothetical protein
MLEDPNERAERFSQISINNPSSSLIDMIDNRPLDVFGNYVVFPSNQESLDKPTVIDEKFKVEKLMSLPTRGVFGEAKLGHCNASEEIDDTRFWDWQKSPIPQQAPDIQPVSTDSRNVTQNLTPTSLPNSIVNIVSPTALPDPTGLASAMNLLGKADIFRDMSTSKEVEDLLKKLSDNSISIADAANKAKEISTKIADQKNNADSNSNNTPQGNSSSGNANTPPITPAQAQQEIKVSENQANKGTITNDEHKANVQKSIGKLVRNLSFGTNEAPINTNTMRGVFKTKGEGKNQKRVDISLSQENKYNGTWELVRRSDPTLSLPSKGEWFLNCICKPDGPDECELVIKGVATLNKVSPSFADSWMCGRNFSGEGKLKNGDEIQYELGVICV